MNKLTLKNSDLLVELKKMKPNSIDHVITSPPYNMNLRVRGGKYVSRQIVKEISSKYENFDDNLPMEEYYEWTKKVIKSLLRVTKNYVFYNIQFITGNKRALFKIIGHFSDQIKEVIIWDKKHGQPAIAAGVMNSQYEIILVISKNKDDTMQRQFKEANFKRGTLSNVWSVSRGRTKVKGHGATFPEELIEKIILNFTKENEVIMDPFLGTGTTGVVALKNNRGFYGIELIEKYFKFAEKEIRKWEKNDTK